MKGVNSNTLNAQGKSPWLNGRRRQAGELAPQLGGTMVVYEREVNASNQTITFTVEEKMIYGSTRLGVLNDSLPMLGTQNNTYSQKLWSHVVGKRTYELSNHLGNVLSVISDKVIPHNNGGNVDYFMADIRQAQDYSPFGVTLEGRNFTASGADGYRHGFNGMEADDELKGDGNSYDFGARMLDPRLGRWLTIDPLSGKYPDLSPYSFVANMPTIAIDPDGKRIIIKGEIDGKKVKIKYVPGMGIPEGASKFTQDAISALNRDFTRELNEDLNSNSCYQPVTDLANSDDVKMTIKQTNKKHPETIYDDGMDGFFGTLGDMIFGRRGVLYFNNEEGLLTGSGNYKMDENGEISVTKVTFESSNVSTIQSPADGLSHEIGHGFNDLIKGIFSKQFYQNSTDPTKYENKEEEDVVKNVDNRNGKIRADHYTAIPFKADNVFDDKFTNEKANSQLLNQYNSAGVEVIDKSGNIK